VANSFEVNIDDLDEDTVWDMLEDFASDDLVTVYFEQGVDDLKAGLTDDIRWDQAASDLAIEVGDVSNDHIARWLNWTMEISDTQSSKVDKEEDTDDYIDDEEL
jgi:hypothetical protein